MNVHRCIRLRTTLPPFPIRSRYFHSTRPNHFFAEAFAVGVLISKSAFTGIHSITGLSWAVSIPLTAAAFRILWLPVMYSTMKNQEKQKAWTPLLMGWRQIYQTQVMKHNPRSPEEAEKSVQTNLLNRKKYFQKKYNMMSGFTNFALQLSFLPMWFINAYVIRYMAAMTDVRDEYQDEVRGTLETKEATGRALDNIIPPEQGLLQESPLWLTDLVSPDTTFILPLAFGALMFANIRFSNSRNMDAQRRDLMAMAPGRARRQRLILLQFQELLALWALACPYFLIKAETPAAVVLFLVGSAATQLISKPLIARAVGYQKPIPPPVTKEAVLKKEYRTGPSPYARDVTSGNS